MPDLKKITLDGVEYQAEAQVLTSLSKATERADAAEKSVQTLTAEKAALQVQLDKAKADIESAKKDAADPKKLDAAVSAKMKLLSVAEAHKVETKDKADADIRKEVVSKAFPKVSLDGKDEVFINSLFDAACDNLEAAKKEEKKDTTAGATLLAAQKLPASSLKDDELDVDKARQKMLDSMHNASQFKD